MRRSSAPRVVDFDPHDPSRKGFVVVTVFLLAPESHEPITASSSRACPVNWSGGADWCLERPFYGHGSLGSSTTLFAEAADFEADDTDLKTAPLRHLLYKLFESRTRVARDGGATQTSHGAVIAARLRLVIGRTIGAGYRTSVHRLASPRSSPVQPGCLKHERIEAFPTPLSEIEIRSSPR
jgi:hypothetical protein